MDRDDLTWGVAIFFSSRAAQCSISPSERWATAGDNFPHTLARNCRTVASFAPRCDQAFSAVYSSSLESSGWSSAVPSCSAVGWTPAQGGMRRR